MEDWEIRRKIVLHDQLKGLLHEEHMKRIAEIDQKIAALYAQLTAET